jgi:hypothetical protein
MIARREQRFARDTALVQARTAQFLAFLDKSGLQSKLAGADGGNIAPRSGANDHNIKFFHICLSLSIREKNRRRNCPQRDPLTPWLQPGVRRAEKPT